MRLVVAVIIAMAYTIIGPTALRGQTVPSPFRYIEPNMSGGIFGGYLWMDSGDLDLGPTPAPVFGGRYTLRFTGPLSGEVDLAYSSSERTVYSRVEGDSADVVLNEEGTTDAQLVLATAGLRFQVTGARTWHNLAPFLTAGGGIVADISGSGEVESEIEVAERVEFGPGFAVALGMGTDWFPTERLSVRLDVRDYLWRITIPAGFTERGEEETDWTHNLGLTLGAALHF
ncbi:MAG TPA: outer membrane beta-barrel protein [Longimicrobiaceae bacterium]|nr:outer membrane beta-barrel protein [Longimicrobiaceae bacterium]